MGAPIFSPSSCGTTGAFLAAAAGALADAAGCDPSLLEGLVILRSSMSMPCVAV